MFWIEIIGIILAFVIFKIWGSAYTNWHGYIDKKEFRNEDKIRRPMWAVILLFIIALLPVLNIILCVSIFGIFVYLLLEGELFLHSNNKIFKWLNKDI